METGCAELSLFFAAAKINYRLTIILYYTNYRFTEVVLPILLQNDKLRGIYYENFG